MRALLYMSTIALALGAVGSQTPAWAQADNRFLVTKLVSDIPGVAANTDPFLRNPWGVSFAPGGAFWNSNQKTGTATLHRGNGSLVSLTVTIPAPFGSQGPSSPTGQVNNPTSDFELAPGKKAIFIFATLDGTISGWNPAVDPTNAIMKVNKSAEGAVYTGLAIGSVSSNNYLYAANFSQGRIDVFDTNFNPVQLAGSFSDPDVDPRWTPFNVQNLGGKLYVTYARFGTDGYVDVFDTNGMLIKRLASHGLLDQPWGLAIAPGSFGRYAGKLLVGNEFNGRIVVVDPDEGGFLGQLKDTQGNVIEIEKLWALTVGGGGVGGSPDKIYFTAGVGNEEHGLFGSIELGIP